MIKKPKKKVKKTRKKSSKYISLNEAQKYCPYSQEYLSLRARQGKLKALKIGRNWVTKKEWVEEYLTKLKKSKKRKKSKLRKKDNKVRKTKKGRLVREVSPPENLPIGQFSEPIQDLFAQPEEETSVFFSSLLFLLVCCLIITGSFLNKESLQQVFGNLFYSVNRISYAGDIIIEEVGSSINKSFTLTSEIVESRIFRETLANVKEIVHCDLEVFKEYWRWLRHQAFSF